jgi:hypothetical protein
MNKAPKQLFSQPYSSHLDEVKAAEGDAHAAGGADPEGEGLRHPEPRQQVTEYRRGEENHQLEDAKHESVLRGRGSLAHKMDKILYCGGAENPPDADKKYTCAHVILVREYILIW